MVSGISVGYRLNFGQGSDHFQAGLAEGLADMGRRSAAHEFDLNAGGRRHRSHERRPKI
jgi:hypothetical protein